MKTIEPPENLSPRLHRDGTVSYWSVAEDRWVNRASYVPDEELDRLDPWRRERVRRHLRCYEWCSRR
jgi:hypothetical protein